jgi:hypothetical protein
MVSWRERRGANRGQTGFLISDSWNGDVAVPAADHQGVWDQKRSEKKRSGD